MQDIKRRKHDLLAAARFLENLHFEINAAKKIDEINDPQILQKLQEIVDLIKTEASLLN